MIAFGTVVYYDAIDYLEDLIRAINSQDFRNFVVLIVNDDIPSEILSPYISKIEKKVIVFDRILEHRSPVQLRVDLIGYAKKEGINLLVLGDCDDMFNSVRISKIVESFKDNKDITFFYNELLFINGKPAMAALPEETTKIDDILEYNYLGLSNTSINIGNITDSFVHSLYECDSFVFDWYLFSRIVSNGGKGIFVPGASTYYRIHDNNYAGIINSITQETLRKEYKVKLNHYKLLAPYDQKYMELYNRYLGTNVELIQPQMTNNSFWWNTIKL